jgi:hypothetical protein
MQLKKLTLIVGATLITGLAFAQSPGMAPAAANPMPMKPPISSTTPQVAPMNAAPMTAPMTAPKQMPAVAAPAATAPAAPSAMPAPKKMAAPAATSAAVAAGGGAGQVWFNAKSNTYHCMGTKYYGKTKEGSYMTEEQAKAKGGHAAHKKSCS